MKLRVSCWATFLFCRAVMARRRRAAKYRTPFWNNLPRRTAVCNVNANDDDGDGDGDDDDGDAGDDHYAVSATEKL